MATSKQQVIENVDGRPNKRRQSFEWKKRKSPSPCGRGLGVELQGPALQRQASPRKATASLTPLLLKTLESNSGFNPPSIELQRVICNLPLWFLFVTSSHCVFPLIGWQGEKYPHA